jgi:thiol:disulfide interchange protein DsbC
MLKQIVRLVFLLILTASLPAIAGEKKVKCPAPEEIARTMGTLSRNKVEVKEIRPGAVEGLCDVFLTIEGKGTVVYTDSSGRFIITGRILDTVEGRDLTREAMAEFNRFTPEEMKKLESLTALTLGKSGPVVYFVTDPM